MKKFRLLFIPLLLTTFLVGCKGGGSNPPDTKNYLCFTCNDDNGALYYGLSMKSPSPSNNPEPPSLIVDLEYSKDKISWFKPEQMEFHSPTFLYYGKICDLKNGESVYLRGDNPNGWNPSGEKPFSFFTPGSVTIEQEKITDLSVSGNIMSIIDKTNFENITELTAPYCFMALFLGCYDISDVSNLLLPATKLSVKCYENMFAFTSIINAPQLPAMELTIGCYANMFQQCRSLIQAPKLPATELVSECYSNMFWGCSNLKQIEVGFGEEGETAWPDSCTLTWLQGTSSTGTFIWNGSTDKSKLEEAGLFNNSHIPNKNWEVKNPETAL